MIGQEHTGGKMEVSQQDKEHLRIIREEVSNFIKYCSKYDAENKVLLDIAPQKYPGAKEFFKKSTIKTLDIDPQANADYTTNICQAAIPSGLFDYVLCTEVLEHVLNPFAAVSEIHRILKPGGYFFLSTPFNFRIHGPLPDCWRFTEHGLKALLKDKFMLDEMWQTETTDRFLMPIHYTVIAKSI